MPKPWRSSLSHYRSSNALALIWQFRKLLSKTPHFCVLLLLGEVRYFCIISWNFVPNFIKISSLYACLSVRLSVYLPHTLFAGTVVQLAWNLVKSLELWTPINLLHFLQALPRSQAVGNIVTYFIYPRTPVRRLNLSLHKIHLEWFLPPRGLFGAIGNEKSFYTPGKFSKNVFSIRIFVAPFVVEEVLIVDSMFGVTSSKRRDILLACKRSFPQASQPVVRMLEMTRSNRTRSQILHAMYSCQIAETFIIWDEPIFFVIYTVVGLWSI